MTLGLFISRHSGITLKPLRLGDKWVSRGNNIIICGCSLERCICLRRLHHVDTTGETRENREMREVSKKIIPSLHHASAHLVVSWTRSLTLCRYDVRYVLGKGQNGKCLPQSCHHI